MGVQSLSKLPTHATGVSCKGVAWVLSECRVKSYIRGFSSSIMAIVECPSCNQDFDLSDIELSVRKRETYECPYCHKEFSNWKLLSLSGAVRRKEQEIERQRFQASRTVQKSKAFLKSLENRDVEKKFEFPLLVGNFKARRRRLDALGTFGIIIIVIFFFLSRGVEIYIVLLLLVVIPLLVIPIKVLYNELKRLKYSKEFAENTLNPEYLRGTGLEIRSNLSAVLITKRRIPRYVFEKKDITKIVFHEETWMHRIGKAAIYELYVHLHGVHALTIYGFNKGDSEEIVSKLISLYDIEFQYNEVHHLPEQSGN